LISRCTFKDRNSLVSEGRVRFREQRPVMTSEEESRCQAWRGYWLTLKAASRRAPWEGGVRRGRRGLVRRRRGSATADRMAACKRLERSHQSLPGLSWKFTGEGGAVSNGRRLGGNHYRPVLGGLSFWSSLRKYCLPKEARRGKQSGRYSDKRNSYWSL